MAEKKKKPYTYNKIKVSDYHTTGLRLWTNGLAGRFDPYKSCQNHCKYCYAEAMIYGSQRRMGIKEDGRAVRIGDIKKLEKRLDRIHNEGVVDTHDFIDWALLYQKFTEVGCLGEPWQDVDEEVGIALSMLKTFKAYGLPMFTNTKGNLLIRNEKYYDALVDLKDNGLVVDLTLISNNWDKLRKYEPMSPTVEERFELLDRLRGDGVEVVISLRPIIRGVTDDNFEEFIERLCTYKPNAIHPRTLVITGAMLQQKMWKEYAKEWNMTFKQFNYRYPAKYFKSLVKRMKPITKKAGVSIVGSHSMFFDLEGNSNKCNYDGMSKKIQEGLYPHTLIPILTNIRKKKKESQVLRWEDHVKPLIYDEKYRNDPWLNANIRLDMHSQTLIWATSSMNKPRVQPVVPMRKIISNSLWDTWGNLRDSYIESTKRIWVITDDDGNRVYDDDNHPIYAYMPPSVKKPTAESTHYEASHIAQKEFEELTGLEI